MNRYFQGDTSGLQRIGEPPHSTLHVTPDAPASAGSSHHVVEKHIGRSWGGYRCERADDRIGGEGRTQNLRFEPTFEHGSRGAGEKLDGLGQISSQVAAGTNDSQELTEIAQTLAHADPAQALSHRVRGRFAQYGLDGLGHTSEQCLVAGIVLRIASAELCNLAAGRHLIRSHQQRAAVGQRCE